MAQWQRVGFQIPRLGVRVPLASRASVTFGSSFLLPAGPVIRCRTSVPVAQLDKASDYESEDWGFKSLQGLNILKVLHPPLSQQTRPPFSMVLYVGLTRLRHTIGRL